MLIHVETETKLKEKKLRVEDALNATKVTYFDMCRNGKSDILYPIKD